MLCAEETTTFNGESDAKRQGNGKLLQGGATLESGPRFVLPPEGIVLQDLERDLLVQALQRCGGNRTRAARLLGLNRDQVRYRIHKFGLEEQYAEPDEGSTEEHA
jgi:DNA-binding NtrC family response regulator